MASMREHVTPLMSCPVLESRARKQGKEARGEGAGGREEGARGGRSAGAEAPDRAAQLSFPGNKPPKGSSAPRLSSTSGAYLRSSSGLLVDVDRSSYRNKA